MSFFVVEEIIQNEFVDLRCLKWHSGFFLRENAGNGYGLNLHKTVG